MLGFVIWCVAYLAVIGVVMTAYNLLLHQEFRWKRTAVRIALFGPVLLIIGLVLKSTESRLVAMAGMALLSFIELSLVVESEDEHHPLPPLRRAGGSTPSESSHSSPDSDPLT
jgi:hypothetical protein